MKKKIIQGFSLVILILPIFAFISCFLSLKEETNQVKRLSVAQPSSPYNEYCGTIHIHSTYSDGIGSPEEIAKAAGEAGLDFVILTDHDTLQALKDKKEGWYGYGGHFKKSKTSWEPYYGKVLLLIGEEISLPCGHLLGLNIPYRVQEKIEKYQAANPQKVIDEINSAGGFSIIAHPYNRKHPWRNWDLSGFNGMEIWNADSDWRDEGFFSLLKSLLVGTFNLPAGLSLLGDRQTEDLTKWDQLNAKSGDRISGMGGADAHGAIRVNKEKVIKFPSYRESLKLICTHILTEKKFKGNLAYDKGIIYESLKRGNFYISNDSLYPAIGFRFAASSNTNQVLMGDEIKVGSSPVKLKARLPFSGNLNLKLIRNGKCIKETKSPSLVYETTKRGIYRIEVTYGKKRRPWIFSNPIYVAP